MESQDENQMKTHSPGIGYAGRGEKDAVDVWAIARIGAIGIGVVLVVLIVMGVMR